MPSPMRCFVFAFNEPDRNEILLDYVRRKVSFSDVISISEFNPKRFELCFLSFNNRANYIALMKRGDMAATAKIHVRFSNYIKVNTTLEVALVAGVLSDLYREGGLPSITWSVLKPKQWSFVRDRAIRDYPPAAAEIEKLERLTRAQQLIITDEKYSVVALEKDAVSAALKIFGLIPGERLSAGEISDSDPVKKVYPGSGGLAPYLLSLENSVEGAGDQMEKFKPVFFGEKWMPGAREAVGVVSFEKKDGAALSVMNLNNVTLKDTKDVDFIYYNHLFKTYVFVRSLSGAPAAGNRKKVEPLIALAKIKKPPAKGSEEYRLNKGGCFVKFFDNVKYELGTTGLLEGHYYPLEFWLAGAAKIRESEKSDDAGRHINEEMFTRLARDGWIGAHFPSPNPISTYIQISLKNKRSVILAMSGGTE